MKILVTGANGYIGRHVVVALLNRGVNVVACDLEVSGLDPRADRVEMNLLSSPPTGICEKFGHPDVCLHLAWRDGFVHNSLAHMDDLSAHFRFLSSMVDGGVKRVAIMGSMHEVGYWEGAITEDTPCNPKTMYAIAKDSLRRAMSQYCQMKECEFQWLRGYYIVGDDRKNNSIFGKILKANDAGQRTFPFTSGGNQYDFIDVEDLAHRIAACVVQNRVLGIINCGSGRPISLAERVEQFIHDNGLDIKLEYGAFPDRPYDSPCVYGDSSKMDDILSHDR